MVAKNEKFVYNFNEILDVILFRCNVSIELRDIVFQYFHLDYENWHIQTLIMQVIASIWHEKPKLYNNIFFFKISIRIDKKEKLAQMYRKNHIYYKIVFSLNEKCVIPMITRIDKEIINLYYQHIFKL
jgi:hypothetical protein